MKYILLLLLSMSAHASEDETCSETAIKFLNYSDRNEQREVDALERMCQKNYNGGCVRAVCEHVGPFECNEMHEMSQVIAACSGNRAGHCVRYECEARKYWDCNELRELIPVARSCAYQGYLAVD